MEDTVRTEQQHDSARAHLTRPPDGNGHVRLVFPDTAVVDVPRAGLTIGRSGDLPLHDSRVSRQHVRVVSGATGWTLEDLGSRNGGFVDGKTFQSGERIPLGDGALIRVGECLLVFRASPRPADVDIDDHGFPGESPAAHEVRRKLATLRASEGVVLIQGETGTGKERAARAVVADRKPLVAQNCGELRKELARSELFGHVQGAFSGAVESKPGRITEAGAGGLFLDEIGDLGLDVQVELLRFFDDGSYRAVGGQKLLFSKARVVAATNRDLDLMVLSNTFRQDLRGRLHAHNPPLHLPSLRDRREDISRWTLRFAREAGLDAPSLWSAGALECLLLYPWPDNLRELRGVIRGLVANAGSPPWHSGQLPPAIHAHRGVLREPAARESSNQIEVVVPASSDPLPAEIDAALRATSGNLAATAKLLKIERTKLWRLCRNLGIAYEGYRSGASPKEK